MIWSDYRVSADWLPLPSAGWINDVISSTDSLCVQRRQIGQLVPRWQLYRYGGDRRGTQGGTADPTRDFLEIPGLRWSPHVPEVQRVAQQRCLSGSVRKEGPSAVAHTGGALSHISFPFRDCLQKTAVNYNCNVVGNNLQLCKILLLFLFLFFFTLTTEYKLGYFLKKTKHVGACHEYKPPYNFSIVLWITFSAAERSCWTFLSGSVPSMNQAKILGQKKKIFLCTNFPSMCNMECDVSCY